MSHVDEIIREAESLPIEQRAAIVESLLRSLNPPEPETDRQWAEVARRRLDEINSGAVQPIPGEDVFAKIRDKYSR